jgi:hypothetical protein
MSCRSLNNELHDATKLLLSAKAQGNPLGRGPVGVRTTGGGACADADRTRRSARTGR